MTPCRIAQQVDRKGRGSVRSRRRGQTMGKVGEPPADATEPVAAAVVVKAVVVAVVRVTALVALAVVSLGEAFFFFFFKTRATLQVKKSLMTEYVRTEVR